MTTISDGTTTLTPALVLGIDGLAQQAGSVVHDIIGAAMPDVTLHPASSRAGTIQTFWTSKAQAEACRALHAQAKVFSYAAAGGELTTATMSYVVAGSGIGVVLEDATRKYWTVSIGFREVAA